MKMTMHKAHDATKDFLYEWPGGMEENEHRDKFLSIADGMIEENWDGNIKVEKEILGHLLRAAFFQGQSVGREGSW